MYAQTRSLGQMPTLLEEIWRADQEQRCGSIPAMGPLTTEQQALIQSGACTRPQFTFSADVDEVADAKRQLQFLDQTRPFDVVLWLVIAGMGLLMLRK